MVLPIEELMGVNSRVELSKSRRNNEKKNK